MTRRGSTIWQSVIFLVMESPRIGLKLPTYGSWQQTNSIQMRYTGSVFAICMVMGFREM